MMGVKGVKADGTRCARAFGPGGAMKCIYVIIIENEISRMLNELMLNERKKRCRLKS